MSELVRLDPGKRLSEAVVHTAGRTVYLAGQVSAPACQHLITSSR